MITLELDAFHLSGNRSVWNNQKLRLPLSPHQLQADAVALRRISRTGEQAKATQMAALDDILAFDDAGTADDIDARHARGQHRVRLLGAEANAPALQEAAPWLSWADSAGILARQLPRGPLRWRELPQSKSPKSVTLFVTV